MVLATPCELRPVQVGQSLLSHSAGGNNAATPPKHLGRVYWATFLDSEVRGQTRAAPNVRPLSSTTILDTALIAAHPPGCWIACWLLGL